MSAKGGRLNASHCRCDELPNVHLDPGAGGFLSGLENLTADFSANVSFTAVAADLRRDILEDERHGPPLKSDGGTASLRLSHLANGTLHGFLLMESASHRAGSGS